MKLAKRHAVAIAAAAVMAAGWKVPGVAWLWTILGDMVIGRIVQALVYLLILFLVFEALVESQNRRDAAASADKEREVAALAASFQGVDAGTQVGPDEQPDEALAQTYHVPTPVAGELGRLVKLVVRDFVSNWYQKLGSDTAFPRYAQSILTQAVGTLCRQVKLVHPLRMLFQDITEALRHHLIWYREVARRVTEAQPEVMRAASVTDRAAMISAGFHNYPGVLHPTCVVTSTTPNPAEEEDQQVRYLRTIGEQLVTRLLPIAECTVVARLLLREIFATKVLLPVMSLFNPHNINTWLLALFELLQEQAQQAPGSPATMGEDEVAGTPAVLPPALEVPDLPSSPVLGSATSGAPSVTFAEDVADAPPALPTDQNVFSDADSDGGDSVDEAAPDTMPIARQSVVEEEAPHPDFDETEASADASQGQVQDSGWRYFAGPVDHVSAQRMLAEHPPGTFLVRMQLPDPTQPPIAAQELVIVYRTFPGDHAADVEGIAAAPTASYTVLHDGQSFDLQGLAVLPSLSACLRAVRHRLWAGLRFETATPTSEQLYGPVLTSSVSLSEWPLLDDLRVALQKLSLLQQLPPASATSAVSLGCPELLEVLCILDSVLSTGLFATKAAKNLVPLYQVAMERQPAPELTAIKAPAPVPRSRLSCACGASPLSVRGKLWMRTSLMFRSLVPSINLGLTDEKMLNLYYAKDAPLRSVVFRHKLASLVAVLSKMQFISVREVDTDLDEQSFSISGLFSRKDKLGSTARSLCPRHCYDARGGAESDEPPQSPSLAGKGGGEETPSERRVAFRDNTMTSFKVDDSDVPYEADTPMRSNSTDETQNLWLNAQNQQVIARVVGFATAVLGAGHSFDPKAVVRYTIVVRLGDKASWKVKRRYNQFHTIDQTLRSKFPSLTLRNALPPKKSFGNYTNAFVESRAAALDAYLCELLDNPAVAASTELRKFLSPEFEAEPSTPRSVLSKPFSFLSSKTPRAEGSQTPGPNAAATSAPVSAVAALAPMPPLSLDGDRHRSNGRQNASSSRRPRAMSRYTAGYGEWAMADIELARAELNIFLLISELFELNKSSWLRRNFVGVTRSLLRLMFYGTALRTLRMALINAVAPANLQWLVGWVREKLWPNDVLFDPAPEPTVQEKLAAQEEVRKHLMASISTPIISLVGTEAANDGFVKLFEFLQCPVIVKSLAYSLVDVALVRIFPGLRVQAFPWIAASQSSSGPTTS